MINFNQEYKIITEHDIKTLEEKRKQPAPKTNIKIGSTVKINFEHNLTKKYYLDICYKVKQIEWSNVFLDYMVIIDAVLNEKTINEIQKSYKSGYVVNPIKEEIFLSDTLILIQ